MVIRLGLNIDHVATLRNARGGQHPCVADAARCAEAAGSDGITLHLREDRRHIKDADIFAVKEAVSLPINLEMAATPEMQEIALKLQPHAVCIVPERREELTTEGGLYLSGNSSRMRELCARMQEAGIRVSLFLDPDPKQLQEASRIGVDIVELHTGTYANYVGDAKQKELRRLIKASELLKEYGVECHAGHGLTYDNTADICTSLKDIKEVNIGHFLIGEALFCGLDTAIARMKRIMNVTSV